MPNGLAAAGPGTRGHPVTVHTNTEENSAVHVTEFENVNIVLRENSDGFKKIVHSVYSSKCKRY